MRFQKTTVALLVGALWLAPAAGANAAEEDATGTDLSVVQGEKSTESQSSAEGTSGTDSSKKSESDDQVAAAQQRSAPSEPTADAASDSETAQDELPAAKVRVTTKVSGTAKVAKRLTASAKVSAPSGVKTKTSYAWYAGSTKLGTGARYTVKAKDRNKRIHAVATVTWSETSSYAAGKASAKSSATAKVKKQKASVSVKVKIKGTAVVGKKLRAKATVKKPSDLKTTGTYTWYVGGKKVKTGKNLRVKASYAGRTIKVKYKVKWKSGTYLADSKVKSAQRKAKYNAAKIVSKARAQVGVYQDCTALVEKALRNTGVNAGDLGTQTAEYTAIGGKYVKSGSYKAGDVFIWQGRHVAVYIGNGKAVHGGYGGNQTVIASAYIDGKPNSVIRFA